MSQEGLIDVVGSNPQILTQVDTNDGNSAIPIANTMEILGDTVPNGTFPEPVWTTSSGNTVEINVQVGAAITGSPIDNNDAGLVSFDDTKFTVDANGFVSFTGTVGETITGNSGGPISPSAGNWNLITANSTVKFVGSGSTLTEDFGLSNLLLGSSGLSITSASSNVGVGFGALVAITSASRNVAIGFGSLSNNLTSSSNVAIGTSNLTTLQSGVGLNVAIGRQVLSGLINGTGNIGIGSLSGNTYTGIESNNILLNNVGVLGESGVIRIGQSGTQTSCYISGIAGISVSNLNVVTINTSTGQLGSATSTSLAGTISGNTGTATTPNWSIVTANSTPVFNGSGSTLTLDFGLSNLLIGSTGSSITSGVSNVGLGLDSLKVISSTISNTAVGFQSLLALTTGSGANVAIGYQSLLHLTTGSGNVGVGLSALGTIVGNIVNNTAVGGLALNDLSTGNYNSAFGYSAGSSYTSNEESNLCLANTGTILDNNTIRIGTKGPGVIQHTKCFIAGIAGVTVSNTVLVTMDSTSGQLGTQATSSGFVNSITGTANQVLANATSGSAQTGAVTLTTPQDIATSSSPTFATVFAGVGSATDPSFSFTGHTNYGMFYSANTLNLAANGTSWFTIGSGGTSTAVGPLTSGGLFVMQDGMVNNFSSTSSTSLNLTLSSNFVGLTSSSARSVVLPAASNTGQQYVIIDTSGNAGTNAITITVSTAACLINGAASYLINTNYGVAKIVFDGTNYFTW